MSPDPSNVDRAIMVPPYYDHSIKKMPIYDTLLYCLRYVAMCGTSLSSLAMYKWTIVIIWFLGMSESLSGQGRPTDYASKYNSGQQQGQQQRPTSSIPDTLQLRYYNIDAPSVYHSYIDTALNNTVHNYDEARHHTVEYIHLGNQGSAATPLIYSARPYVGFDAGYHQYDMYNFSLQSLKFYEGNVPLVNGIFTPVGSQDNFTVKADFARSYSDGFAVSANYRRISQAGIYQSEATKTTNLAVSLRYQSASKRYSNYLSIISNVNEQDNGGGPLSIGELDARGRGFRRLISPTLTDASTRHQQKYYNLTNYYELSDSAAALQVLLRYDIGADYRYYKYADDDLSSINDDTYYDTLLVDERGLRHYTRINRLHNSFYAYLTDNKKLNVRAGIVYDKYDIEQDVALSTYHNAYLAMDGSIPFLKSLSLQTSAQLGIGDGAGDFNVDGALKLQLGKIADVTAGITLYRYTPSLLQRSLYVSQINIWEHDFTNPVGSDLYAKVRVPYLNLSAEMHQHVVNNAVYYNAEAIPVQYGSIYTNTSLAITQDMHYGIFYLENSILLQLQNENIYGLPTYWSRHNFYLQFHMFKRNLLSRWGVETRLSPAYDGLAYNAGVGVFHLSGQQTEFYPMTDVYFSGKVQKFRLFVKLENVNQLIDATKVDFRIANHPQHDWAIRFGVGWLFLG